MSLISQLISGISRVLKILFKYFNGTIISTYSLLPATGVFPVIWILDLNDLESVTVACDSSLYYWNKLPGVFEELYFILSKFVCTVLNITLSK